MVMESTTLVTFTYKAPPEVRTVELFGSWDNFSKGYRMVTDAHKGRGYWTGCHRFENIVCDGVKPDWSKPRSGALKQGGKYWYYYKLDDEDEEHDLAQPSTTACPLLPGQTVNIIEIPIEVVAPPQRTSSASPTMTAIIAPVMSLDPADRYKKTYRKHPTKLPRHYCSSDALQDRTAALSSSFIVENGGPVRSPPSSKQQISHRILKRVRGSHAQPQQQPVSCLGRPTTAQAAALLQSIATTIPELGRLPTLRPFGPTPPYLTANEHDRPSTRHGSAEGQPFGFGFGPSYVANERPSSRHGSAEDQSTDHFDTFGAAPASLPDDRPCTRYGSAGCEAIGLGITFPTTPISGNETPRPHSPSIYSTPSERPGWPFRHSNPLAANPPTTGLFSPVSSTQSYHHHHHQEDHPMPPPEEMILSSFDERRGTGIFDMLSPTFTAATMSSVDDQEGPSDSFRLDDYMDQDYTSAWLASTHSMPSPPPEDAAVPVKRHSALTEIFSDSGENESSSSLTMTTPSPVLGETVVAETGPKSCYTSFPDFVPSGPVTLEPENVVGEGVETVGGGGGDFAREVFGALGLRKLGWF